MPEKFVTGFVVVLGTTVGLALFVGLGTLFIMVGSR